MSERAEYIQLEPNDDVAHLRDRLSFIRGRRVLVVWPETGTALTRKLDLVLIQREAKRRAIQLGFVTHDRQVLQHAADLGISTFETIGASERARWKRGRAKVFTQRHHKPEDDPDHTELSDVASRVRNPRRQVSRVRFVLERLLLVGFLVAVVGATLYIVVPSATIVITLDSETIEVTVPITADPTLSDVDVENGVMPATIVRADVQTTGTIPTTGISALGDKPAIGIVVFANETLNNVTIPAGTVIATSIAPVIGFRTIADVTVRGGVGQQADIAIEALPQNAGDMSNVEAGTINAVVGDLAGVVSVINLSPTTGGETRQFATITQEDMDRLIATVRGQLQATAYSEMQGALTNTQLIVIETVNISEERTDWTEYDGAVGDIANTLSLTMRAVVQAVVIDDRFARQIVFARLSSQKPSGKVLLAESFTYERGAVQNVQDNSVTFSAAGTVRANAVLDTSQLAERLAGTTLADAQAIIAIESNLAPGVVPQFILNPEKWSTLPLLPIRITIETINP